MSCCLLAVRLLPKKATGALDMLGVDETGIKNARYRLPMDARTVGLGQADFRLNCTSSSVRLGKDNCDSKANIQ